MLLRSYSENGKKKFQIQGGGGRMSPVSALVGNSALPIKSSHSTSSEHSRISSKFSNQNLRQIGPRRGGCYDRTPKQTNRDYYFTYSPWVKLSIIQTLLKKF